jgi:extradiol dioxygenase family protein
MPAPDRHERQAVFHLAFPVDDLEAARAFYVGVLGCGVGREDATWIDFDLRGHQIVAHLDSRSTGRASWRAPKEPATNLVDGDDVPVPHFGLVLEWDDWRSLVDRLRSSGAPFLIEPHVRFAGGPGEQATLFLSDPAGNALEFKAFRDPARLFARDLP